VSILRGGSKVAVHGSKAWKKRTNWRGPRVQGHLRVRELRSSGPAKGSLIVPAEKLHRIRSPQVPDYGEIRPQLVWAPRRGRKTMALPNEERRRA